MFGDATTGAESDIQQVTRIARGMVERWGMSEKVGFLTVAPQDGQSPLLPGAEPVSQATQELIDAEVRRIVDEEQDATEQLLADNRDKLDSLAETLLERETLDEADAYAAAGHRPDPGRGPMSDAIERALAEDLGDGDLTTRAVVPEGALARARIVQKEPGVIAGLRVAQAVFQRVDPELAFMAHCPEGKWREAGAIAADRGLGRLDPRRRARGAELPRAAVGSRDAHRALRRRPSRARARASSTRARRPPGCASWRRRRCARAAGVSHRSGLYDAILVKENHAALAGGVGEATRLALERAPEGVTVEVECATLGEVEEAVAAGVPRILLDNMAPDDLRRAVELADGRAELEASGGITLETVRRRRRDRRRLHQRRRAHALGAGARRQPAARAAVGGRSTANGSVTARSREPNR